MSNLLLGLRDAVRRLLHSPEFTLTAALTLAFGIAAAAIISTVEGFLRRPLPGIRANRSVSQWITAAAHASIA